MPLAGKLFFLSALTFVAAFAGDTPSVVSTFRPESRIFPRDVLTNEGIVTLADAGFSDSFIVEKIQISHQTHFDTSVEGLAYLRQNAISEELVRFIMEHVPQPLTPPSGSVTPVVLARKGKHKNKNVAIAPAMAASVAPAVIVPSFVPTAMPAQIVTPSKHYSEAALPAGLWTGAPYSYTPGGYGLYGYPAAPSSSLMFVTTQQSGGRHWWRWW